MPSGAAADDKPGAARSWGRRAVEFGGGLRGEVVRGRHDGPEVWLWVPSGARAPSMVQAAAALRDRLDAARMHGSVGFLLDGPLLRTASPSASERRAAGVDGKAGPRRAALVGLREATRAASLLLSLVEGPGDQAQRLELDVEDARARQIARGTGVALLVKAPLPADVDPPLLTLVDGVDASHPTIDAAVVTRVGRVLEATLASLSLLVGLAGPARTRPRVPLRVIIRRCVTVERGELGGTAQVTVAAGDVVRAGDVLALVGPPGLSRVPLVAPISAVVLSVQRSTGGPVLLLGKVERALARLESRRETPPERRRIVSGWSEWVALPDLGIPRIKAKLDTGARTCALHVRSLVFVDGAPGEKTVDTTGEALSVDATPPGPVLADIEIPVGRRGRHVTVRCQVVEFASVRDSGGHAERRPVIETRLVLGGVARTVRVSLTDRGDMLFPMLIGRTALGGEFVVDPSTRFRFGRLR